MSLSPITSAEEIRQARQTMLTTLRRGCQRHRRWIGWQGGGEECDLEWNERDGFWVAAEPLPDENRWVIFFGTQNPTSHQAMSIVCEINPPKVGFERRCAGLFARDPYGTIYFTHSGKIGGGRKGIGKSAFLANYRGARETMSWPDQQESEVIVIGRIDNDSLRTQVANFICEVQRFKLNVSHGKAAPTEQEQANTPSEPHFNPEFSGKRRGYAVQSEIETRCDHGLIVNALANALQQMGLTVANDRNRDLFVPGPNSRMEILFEAKPDVTTSSIYEAIGQLLYHSSAQARPPLLVMVLPATPNARTKRVFDLLRIDVLTFGWQGHQPKFHNLAEIIRPAAG